MKTFHGGVQVEEADLSVEVLALTEKAVEVFGEQGSYLEDELDAW